MKEAGRKREREREMRSYGFEELGGSEPMATWKKTPVKVEATRMMVGGAERERRVVNTSDTASKLHRKSVQCEVEMPGRKVNDDGNPASKPNDDIPCRLLAGKSWFSPIMEKTPQPPYLSDTKPA